MKIRFVGILILLALWLSSCYHYVGNSGVPSGVIPNIFAVDGENGFSGNAYSPGSSKGEACSKTYTILWLPLISVGDASIGKAAENGQIIRIDSVSHRINVPTELFAWKQEFCTIVRGEKLRKELLEQR